MAVATETETSHAWPNLNDDLVEYPFQIENIRDEANGLPPFDYQQSEDLSESLSKRNLNKIAATHTHGHTLFHIRSPPLPRSQWQRIDEIAHEKQLKDKHPFRKSCKMSWIQANIKLLKSWCGSLRLASKHISQRVHPKPQLPKLSARDGKCGKRK